MTFRSISSDICRIMLWAFESSCRRRTPAERVRAPVQRESEAHRAMLAMARDFRARVLAGFSPVETEPLPWFVLVTSTVRDNLPSRPRQIPPEARGI